MNEERIQKIQSVLQKRQFSLTVILENVIDPHNLGAVLRTCDSVGCAEVYVLYTAPQKQKEVLRLGKKTAAGVRKWLDVRYFTDLEKCFEEVRKNYSKIYATALGADAHSIYDIDFTESTAILFGSEKDGVSEAALSKCDGNIVIPQVGMAQSLNISVACAVTLFEAFRQRNEKGFYDENQTIDSEKRQKFQELILQRNTEKDRVRFVKKQ